MKRFLLLLIAFMPMFAMAYGYDFVVDGLYYKITSSSDLTVEVTYKTMTKRYEKINGFQREFYTYISDYSGDITIPTSIVYKDKQYKVTGIGSNAFSDCEKLTSVNIPNSVFSIGYGAFRNCKELISIKIPRSVNSPIDMETFKGCSKLTTVELSDRITVIGAYAFDSCCSLTTSIIHDAVKEIGPAAFRGCSGLKTLNIPKSVTTIGNDAFNGCSGLASITIPNSITKIGWRAFEGCSGDLMLNCDILQHSTSEGVFQYSTFNKIEIGPDVRTIARNHFQGCKVLTTLTIPNTVTFIGSNTFAYCDIRKLVLNCSLRSFTYDTWGSFYWAHFDEVEIGNDVEYLGNSFYCSSTNHLTISGVNAGVPHLAVMESIKVLPGNKNYDSRGDCNAVIRTSDNTLVLGCGNTIIPTSVTSIGYSAFNRCSELKNITIPHSVTSIGSYAFSGCTGLAYITIPNSVTSIGTEAFSGCTGLTSIAIPNSVTVTNYDYGVFANCTSLTTVTLSNSMTVLPLRFFENCTSLTSVIIPNSVTCIDEKVFANCSSLSSVVIPNSVTDIRELAFSSCLKLRKVKCKAIVPPTLGNNVFDKNTLNGILYVPKESVKAYEEAEGWSLFYEIKAIDDPVSPGVDEESEITDSNASDITAFKMNVKSGSTFAINDDAKVELWIGGILKGIAEKKDISEKFGEVTAKFTPVSKSAGARGMLDEFWNTVAATASDDVTVVVNIKENSFKVNGEDIDEELSFMYTAKSSVAEKIDQVLAIDEIDANSGNAEPVYNLNGFRINGNIQKGIIIKNGNKVLVK